MAFGTQNTGRAPSGRVLVVVLLILSIALVTVYSREGEDGVLHTVQSTVGGLANPFRSAGAHVGAAAGDAAENMEDATADEATLSQLREENAQLREENAQLEEYRQEAERLSGLLNLQETYSIEGVSARVIGRSTEAWNQTVIIDVGEDDGIGTGLTVMGAAGVVGQVVDTTAGSATVRLLTDPQSGAAAIIQTNRAEGVVRGSLDGLLYLENVDADVQVIPGDYVLTSGLGGSYARGLLIGMIVKVEGAQGDAARRIVVAPNTGVQVLEEVIVVLSNAGTTVGLNIGGE